MPKVINIGTIGRDTWTRLVDSSPTASWFQTAEAFDFYDSLPFLEAFSVGVEDDGGRLKGIVVGFVQKDGGRLKQFLSRRAIINGGPLLAHDITEEELIVLLKSLKSQLRRKAIYIETRNFNDFIQWRKVFENCGFFYEPHYDIWVDTSSKEVLDNNLGKSRKRDIRLSLRDGATIITQPSLIQVREFYEVLSDLYRNKVKTPLFPIAFFEKMYQLPSSAFLLVEYDGRIVGGTVCVGLEGNALYEMYACGKDGVFKNIFPSELATFAGLQYAAEHGMPRFDMMGAGRPNDGGYGVRDFKLKFGGDLKEFGRNVYVSNRMLYEMGKLGVKILKKI